MPYYYKLFFRFLVFFFLFVITQYIMSIEDVFASFHFKDVYVEVLLYSIYIGLACVVLMEVITFFAFNKITKTTALIIGILQIYLNFTFFEYFIVFKTPLYGRDIIYLNDPTSIWLLALGSIENIRFFFLVVVPSALLIVIEFFFKKNLSVVPKVVTILLIVVVGYSIYQLQKNEHNKFTLKNPKSSVGYLRNNVIVVYEAIANYLQFKEEVQAFPENNPVVIRKYFRGQQKRAFNNESTNYPLLQDPRVFKTGANHSAKRKKKNLIILMLESLPSSEIYGLGKTPNYKGATPFLDNLIRKSTVIPNTYATGIHTFFGTSDVLVGVPSYNYNSWNKKVDVSYYFSLPNILNNNGYRHSHWYHGGADPNFDKKNFFSKNVGFTKSVFIPDFSSEALRANWGLADREIYLRLARDIKSLKPPFFTFVLNLTKHGPWNIPKDFDEDGFKRNYLEQHNGVEEKGIRNSIRLTYYYDQIIKELFHSLEGHPNFENSLVIITSDQAFFPDIKDKNQYQTMINGFRIPFIIYDPGNPQPNTVNTFASHLDFIPTLIDLLDLEVPSQAPYFGRNILDPAHTQNPDAHSHIGYWNGKLLHFVDQGIYIKNIPQPSSTEGKQDNPLTFLNHLGEMLGDEQGETLPPDYDSVDQSINIFGDVYPYLLANDLVFPITK